MPAALLPFSKNLVLSLDTASMTSLRFCSLSIVGYGLGGKDESCLTKRKMFGSEGEGRGKEGWEVSVGGETEEGSG